VAGGEETDGGLPGCGSEGRVRQCCGQAFRRERKLVCEGNIEGRGLQDGLFQCEESWNEGLQRRPGGFGIPFGKLPRHAIGGVETTGRCPVAQQIESEAADRNGVIRTEGEGGDGRGGGGGPAAELRCESTPENRLRLGRLCFAEEIGEGRQGFRNSISIVDGNGGRFCDARIGVVQKLSGGGMAESGEGKDRNCPAADSRISREGREFRRIGAARESRYDGMAGEGLHFGIGHAQQGGNRGLASPRSTGKGRRKADTWRGVGQQPDEGVVGTRRGR
jgi:hypothetical protein